MKNNSFANVFRTLKLILRYDKFVLFLYVGTYVIKSVSPFISVYFSKYATEYLSAPSYSVFLFFIGIVAFLAVTYLIRIVTAFLNSVIDKRSSHLRHKIKLGVFSKCLRSTYRHIIDKEFLEKKSLAANACNADKPMALITDFMSICSSLIIIAGMAYTLKGFSFVVAVALAAVVLINFITAYYTKKANYQMDVFDSVHQMKTSYVRGIANDFKFAKDIRIYGMENGISEKMDRYDREAREQLKKHYSSLFRKNTLIEITTFIFNIIVYLSLGYKFLVMKDMSLSEFVFMLGAVTSAFGALQSMINSVLTMNSDAVYVRDYFAFVDYDSEICDKNTAETVNLGKIETIEFRNVSFKYPESDEWAVHNLNLRFDCGKAYMIVGKNGAGKSTLIKLLLRLYTDYEGDILINGADIRTIGYQEYMKIVSVLFQDFNMLSMPVIENLAPNEAEVDYGRIEKLIEAVGLSQKIASLEKGLDSWLYRMFDKKGVEFSGGEMQKLAVVRALYKDSSVAIFDEPTSALDIYAEQKVLECISNAREERIVLFTTHRLNMKNIASEIIVIDQGTVAEKGTHEELLKNRAMYYELFTAQAAGYKAGGL